MKIFGVIASVLCLSLFHQIAWAVEDILAGQPEVSDTKSKENGNEDKKEVDPGPVDGVCSKGPFVNANFGNPGTALAAYNKLCNSGTLSDLSGEGPWSWTCQGSNGGMDAYCDAQPNN